MTYVVKRACWGYRRTGRGRPALEDSDRLSHFADEGR
jgi:hypothetical protein